MFQYNELRSMSGPRSTYFRVGGRILLTLSLNKDRTIDRANSAHVLLASVP